MLLLPPGYSKSTLTSILYPVYWLSRKPGSLIMLASHTADLARSFARQGREWTAEFGALLGLALAKQGRHSAGEWETSNRGRLFATGVGGGLIGRHADLAIIDDPIKSLADITSAQRREALLEWYQAQLLTRLKPGAPLILAMARWHQDDLAGKLLARDAAGWKVVRLPALAEGPDELGRAAGDALWPQREGAGALARTRLAVGEYVWAAQYQQAPIAREGRVFLTGSLVRYEPCMAQAEAHAVRGWDLAATREQNGNDPDYTVGVKLGRLPDQRLIVLDVVRFRDDWNGVQRRIRSVAEDDGVAVRQGFPLDPGAGGKAAVDMLAKTMQGYVFDSSQEKGRKADRADAIAAQVNAGQVVLAPGAWQAAFCEELKHFPEGKHDDQVDALSRAFALLLRHARPGKRADVPHSLR
jgi:predicted phage terminase large subunit-like protein